MSVLVLRKGRTYTYKAYVFERNKPRPVADKADVDYLMATRSFELVKTDSGKQPAGLVINKTKKVTEVAKTGEGALPKFGNKQEIVKWVEKNAPGVVLDLTKTKKAIEEQLLTELKTLAATETSPVEEAGTGSAVRI